MARGLRGNIRIKWDTDRRDRHGDRDRGRYSYINSCPSRNNSFVNLYPSLPTVTQMAQGLRGNVRIKCNTDREVKIETEIETEIEIEIEIGMEIDFEKEIDIPT